MPNTARRFWFRAILMPMDWTPDGEALRGRVAVVAGATRGAGRGIAAALGEAGATVVCTGRSSTSGGKKSDYDRPETIEETAALVDDLGGHGVAIQVDHLEADEVRALAHRIRGDYGRIDILVNDIWGAEVLKGPPPTWNRPIWEHDLDDWSADTSARHRHPSHYLALPAPAADRAARRAACRGHRRHPRIQRRELPALGVLRPGQDRGEPARIRTRT